ncbi:MAG: DUF4339 domain-containing protein [Puniceicoccales bacterium]|jgi:hypothetical protein|nr:DUF4339 domain-containing protein [Puniceicoccales bacterium]
MESQQYSFFLENEVKGPFSRVEAEAMVARREISADTPCAPVGSTEWEPSSKFFTFSNGGIRLNTRVRREATVEHKTEDDRPSLDAETRKKVIQLGIADAASLDSLTVEQAQAAIHAYEKGVEKAKKGKIIGGISALVGSFVVGIIFGMTGPGESFNNWVANKFVKESPTYLKQREEINRDLSAIEEARKTLAESQLKQPEGRPGKDYFGSRVVIPSQKSTELLFHIEYAKLSEYTSDKPTVLYLKRMPSDIKKEMIRQAELVWKYTHPDSLTDPLTAEELAASWEIFKTRVGNTLPNFIKENTQDVAKEVEDGDISVNGSYAENLVATVTVNDFPLYFPYDKTQKYVSFSKPQQHVVTQEEALEVERYAVTSKETAGGGFYGLKVRFMGQQYTLKRPAPVWHYVALARKGIDSSPSWIMVSSDDYEKTAIDTEYPTKQLFTYTVFDNPLPSPLTGMFELIQQ